MAYRTRSNATALQSRLPSRENDLVVQKSKSFSNVGTGRSALGAIGNVINKENVTRGKKLARSTSLKPASALEPVVENVSKENIPTKKDVQKRSPSPPIMEVIKQAFSEQQLANVEDIDKDDHENPQLVSEYVNDIYKYMLHLEQEFKVRGDYMEDQEINARMRSILIDWLVQVHLRFHLLQETLFLTVSILDRFLQIQQVSRSKLQLVGVTAMFIASKYEEMYAPEIGDFVYITDNAYTKSQIRAMECMMLKTIDYSLGKPLCLHFLRRNSKAGGVDAQKHTLAKYLMELTLQEYGFVQYNPSEIAAAALCLSMKLLDESSTWTDTLYYYSTYSEEKVLPIIKKMCKQLVKSENSKLQAVRNKYNSSKFMKISCISELKSSIVTEFADQAS
ncbi:cyclin B [Saccoglossus kowalevskii]|uniref:Cyclin B n=1 Tax=Saccoglossus kowalevskii TaxID=10224 RepID=B5THL4_SACKO|nr:cyclin B [Saccoglossus kowalevskii]ACH73222.1 cyclin B protein [Saccoglossus kowalevskii]